MPQLTRLFARVYILAGGFFIHAGFISGDELERISVQDYAAYDQASTYCNWRLPAGYGTLTSTHAVRISTGTISSKELDGSASSAAAPASDPAAE